jgi:hypothetical protein
MRRGRRDGSSLSSVRGDASNGRTVPAAEPSRRKGRDLCLSRRGALLRPDGVRPGHRATFLRGSSRRTGAVTEGRERNAVSSYSFYEEREVDVTTKKQKARAAAAGKDVPTKPKPKKKTSRGK